MSIEEKIKTAKEDSWLKDSVSEKEFKEIKDNERRMSREEAISIMNVIVHMLEPQYDTDRIEDALEMAIQSLTAISELSKSLKAVNRYEMDKKVLIGFNMAVAIFNKCFGESCALKNEQSEQNVGMCQQNVGELSESKAEVLNEEYRKRVRFASNGLRAERQTDGDLISRKDLLNKIWQKEYGKDYDGVNMLNIPHIDIIENMPRAEKTAEWIPVKDRMPEFNDIVLASTVSDYDELRVILTVYKAEEFWFNGIIKAWMPLPKPYKAE